jgi:hypothetical protein
MGAKLGLSLWGRNIDLGFLRKLLRRVFGPKRGEEGVAGHVARMERGRGVCRVLVGRLECKRPQGRPRRRWEDNINLDLREIGIEGANWIQLAQDSVQWRAFVNTVMTLRVP